MSTTPTVSALKCPQCAANLPVSGAGYIICPYCGSSLVISQPQAASPAEPQPAVPTAAAPTVTVTRGLKLHQIIVTDTEGSGLELFRMLAPVGWNTRGGCRWALDNPGMPATISFQLWNPQGAEAFEILPNLNLTWQDNPLTRMLHPAGSRYFGAEVRPPMGIEQALRELVAPRYRSSVQQLSAPRFESLPELPYIAKSEALLSGEAEGGKLRLHYRWQGADLEEDIYGIIERFSAPTGSFMGGEVIMWYVDFLFSCRAVAGKLDAAAELYAPLIGSFRLNPEWYAAFQSVIQMLAQQQIQRIQHVGQIGQMLAQAGSEMRQQNLNAYLARQATFDRLSAEQSRAIRDTSGYYDPHRGEVVELPAGYGYAWANNLGEYIVTAQAGFDPNIGSNLHWEPMSQR